ncbi:MAG: YqaA family protein [Pseudomonadota bacterium]
MIYLAVFASAFLAATLLPFYSEVTVAFATRQPDIDLLLLWLSASVGNTLGAVVNWAIGRAVLRWRGRRWFPVSDAQLERAQRWFARFGIWSLLFAWLPFGGDPLTFAAGALRVRLVPFVLLVGAGKTARYAVVILLAEHAAPT